jgi:hypothetical protein
VTLVNRVAVWAASARVDDYSAFARHRTQGRVGACAVEAIAVETAVESGNSLHFGCALWVCAARIGEGEPDEHAG